MHLYWKNTAEDGLWSTVANWYKNAAATVPHGALPTSGDSCSYATGETASVILRGTIDLGSGTCDIPGWTGDSGHGFEIHGGTWTGANAVIAFANIFGGVFTGNITNLDAINGGLFTGNVTHGDAQGENSATIYGGIFTGAVVNLASGGPSAGGSIVGGVFTGSVDNSNGQIENAILACEIIAQGTIEAALWLSTGFLNVGGILIQGAGASPLPKFTTIHGYGDIFGTALL